MAKIFRHRRLLPDEHVGNINDNGQVYREKFGRDEFLGAVDYQEGRVHGHVSFGGDTYLGNINEKGEIHSHKSFGSDDYVARVKEDGSVYRHVSLRPDELLGKVEGMRHPVEGAAAFFFFFQDEASNEPPAE